MRLRAIFVIWIPNSKYSKLNAPSSTKKKEGKRDPDMHQTKKGNQYFFDMKAHIGVDAESGLAHSLVGTAANVADVTQVG
ncbi:ISPssy transposase or derivative [Pseudomonas amygdali pv. mellea]|nr:ISPssy transposase or derivative [Pseudomonas amygdali]KPX87769.1 ISPssy transposase or derivative [Pseudomonas amygdali pv. mellea]